MHLLLKTGTHTRLQNIKNATRCRDADRKLIGGSHSRLPNLCRRKAGRLARQKIYYWEPQFPSLENILLFQWGFQSHLRSKLAWISLSNGIWHVQRLSELRVVVIWIAAIVGVLFWTVLKFEFNFEIWIQLEARGRSSGGKRWCILHLVCCSQPRVWS